ncbi:hypothetical protein HRbin08_01337 [bacterium HR08]|nr:hypothetical protein HRbin08_01337 [bacterium HR08]
MEPWLRPDEEAAAMRQADLIKGIEQALYLLEAAPCDPRAFITFRLSPMQPAQNC